MSAMGGTVVTRRQTAAGAASAAALAGVMAFVGHEAGWFAHVAESARPGLHEIVSESGRAAIDQGADTFYEIRTGTDRDEALVKASCAALDAYYAKSPSGAEVHQAIDDRLPREFGPGSPAYQYLRAKVDKVSNTVAAISDEHVHVFSYYATYCVHVS
jgi:hypothetical protein